MIAALTDCLVFLDKEASLGRQTDLFGSPFPLGAGLTDCFAPLAWSSHFDPFQPIHPHNSSLNFGFHQTHRLQIIIAIQTALLGRLSIMSTAHNINNNDNVVDVHGSLFHPASSDLLDKSSLAFNNNDDNNDDDDDIMLEYQGDDDKKEELLPAAQKRISIDATATTTTTTTTQGCDWNDDDDPDDFDSDDDDDDDVISIAPFDPDSSGQLLPGTWYHHHHHHVHTNDPNLYLPQRWPSGEAEDICPTKTRGNDDRDDDGNDKDDDDDSIFHMLIDCSRDAITNSPEQTISHHLSNDTAAGAAAVAVDHHHHHADLLPSLLMTDDDEEDGINAAAAAAAGGVSNSPWTALRGTIANTTSALAPAALLLSPPPPPVTAVEPSLTVLLSSPNEFSNVVNNTNQTADGHEQIHEEEHDLCSILQQVVESNVFDGIMMEQDEGEVVVHDSGHDNDVVMAGITKVDHKLDWQDPPDSAPSPLLRSSSSSSFLSEDSLQQHHQQQCERLAASMRRSQKSRTYITKNYGALLQGHLQQRVQWSKVLKDIETSSAQIQKHFLLADQPHPVLEPELQHLPDEDDPNLDDHFATVTDESPAHSS